MHIAKPGYDKLIFELSSPGREAFSLAGADVPESDVRKILPEKHLRRTVPRSSPTMQFWILLSPLLICEVSLGYT